MLVFCFDRASNNISAMANLLEQIRKLSPTIFVFFEACNAHGCYLAKSCSPMGKNTAGALVSFSKVIRNNRTYEALMMIGDGGLRMAGGKTSAEERGS
jgi:hypothetical protein